MPPRSPSYLNGMGFWPCPMIYDQRTDLLCLYSQEDSSGDQYQNYRPINYRPSGPPPPPQNRYGPPQNRYGIPPPPPKYGYYYPPPPPQYRYGPPPPSAQRPQQVKGLVGSTCCLPSPSITSTTTTTTTLGLLLIAIPPLSLFVVVDDYSPQ